MRVVIEEAERLTRRGHRVVVLASSVRGKHPLVHRVIDLGWRSRVRQVGYYTEIVARAGDAHVLHGFYTPWLAALDPPRTIVSLPGLAVTHPPSLGFLHRRALRARFHTVSESTRRSFLELMPGAPPERVHAVHLGVDIDFFTRSDIRIAPVMPRIIFVGRWIRDKGVGHLLKATRILQESGVRFRLVMIGGISFSSVFERMESAKYARQIEEAKASLPIETPGLVNYETLRDYYRTADIGVVPSIYEESFGLINCEMGACGLPVVATKVGGIPEIIEDGETGILVPPDDAEALAKALHTLIGNREMRHRMGDAARRRMVESFSWERHVERMEQIYYSIVAERER